MKQVWAPWRMEYISGKRRKTCFLCEIGRENRDEENLVLLRGTHCFIVMNLYPYTNGHLLVAPLRHLADFSGLNDEARLEMLKFCEKGMEALKKAHKAQGFNVGLNLGKAAGAGLEDHLHWHIVPRWVGDTNFMPVLGEVKVISQHLKDTYNTLKSVLNARKNGEGSQKIRTR
jgi:ATP adenylyltransferase